MRNTFYNGFASIKWNTFVSFVTCCSFPKMSLTNLAKERTLNVPKHKGIRMNTKPFTITKNCKVSYRQLCKQVMEINQNNHLYLLDYNKPDRTMHSDILKLFCDCLLCDIIYLSQNKYVLHFGDINLLLLTLYSINYVSTNVLNE